jgi:glycine betaine/proline transport system ATP-binding protein
MDEPFSALDPLIRGKLQDELLALQERVRKTILFVSHDMDEALRLGDRITILKNGRIVQTGTAEDIVLSPADEYVAEFVRHMNPLDVLTGSMIMRGRTEWHASADGLWLDANRRYCAVLDAQGELLEVRLDGAAPAVLAIVPATLSLQEIIHLRQSTGHPVLLAENGRILGVCGETEIIRALAGNRKAPGTPALAP